MDNINVMEYWLNSAERDYDTMKVMFENKKNTWCLFLGHLVIEKLLKGLLALAEKCNLDLTEEQIKKLQIITQFNISARYDDYKESFYQKCTDDYTALQVKNIEEVYTWLKSLLMEK